MELVSAYRKKEPKQGPMQSAILNARLPQTAPEHVAGYAAAGNGSQQQNNVMKNPEMRSPLWQSKAPARTQMEMAQLFDLSGGQSGPLLDLEELMRVPAQYGNSTLVPIDPSESSRYNDGENGENE